MRWARSGEANFRVRAPTALSIHVSQRELGMPDRELPEHLRARLSADLMSGAPLASPLPSQARYARGAAEAPRSHPRGRLVAAAAAGLALLVIAATVGPSQSRHWIGQSVGSIVNHVKLPGGQATAPPTNSPPAAASHPAGGAPTPRESPDGARSPEPSEASEPTNSPEPQESPEPAPQGSPEPSQAPDNDGDGGSPSPTPSGGDGDGSSGSGGGGG